MSDKAYNANNRPGGYFKDLLKSIAIAFIVTFIILVVAALLLCFLDFPEKYALPSVIAATVLGILAGSYRSARVNEGKRMTSALLLATVYILLAYIMGCLVQGHVMVSSNTALYAAIGLITGAIGGLLAGRTGKNQNKYKGNSGLLSDKFSKSGASSYKFKKTGS